MEWRRLKNIIILILLLVNGFLLVLVGARYSESVQYERTALERTLEVLEGRGIRADADRLAPAGALAPLTVERDLERELQLAKALLGPGEVRPWGIQAENQGGGLYRYQFDGCELTIRPGGELSAAMRYGPHQLIAGDLERHAAQRLKKMGIEAEQIGVTRDGEWTRIRFRQMWNGAPVFSCEVEFVYEAEFFRTVQGTLLTAQAGTAEAGECMTLPTALMRFYEEISASGDVCSAILSMEPGYRAASQSLSGGIRLAPVWLVTTDTAQYYLDCSTGALTRLTDGQPSGMSDRPSLIG